MNALMQIIVHIRGGFSPVMSSVLAVGKYFQLGIILALACLACVLSYVPAVSQTSPTQLPNPLKLGVRTSVYPIGNNIRGDKTGADGFCGTFGKELKEELASHGKQITVEYIPIVNQHKGVWEPRYHGLKTDKIDIECGPNSILSGKLPTGEGIEFSRPFYKTGVKLLLKEELAKKLNSGTRVLKEIKIGVVRESTTLGVLQSIKDIIDQDKVVPYDSSREALNALEDNLVQGFASDALIVGTFLKKGVKGQKPSDQLEWNIFNNRVDQPGQPFRPPYENLGYIIYPNSSLKIPYLTMEPTEEYAMAVKENTPFSKELLNVINNTLNKPKVSGELQKLKEYETRVSNLSWNDLKKLLRFITTHVWVVLVPFIWALFSQFLSQVLHQPLLTSFTWATGIILCGSILFIIVILIILEVIPRFFPGY
jgi:ABC-type amino acid transport substrate-binding protein